MIASEQMFEHMSFMADRMSSHLYWLDLDQKIIDVNQKTLDSIDTLDKTEIIGKTFSEIFKKSVADNLIKNTNEVIENKIEIKKERYVEDADTKDIKYYLDIVSPIYDQSNTLVGIIYNSLDITAEKECQRLKIENECTKLENRRYKEESDEQIQFRKLVDQVSHDIRSPISTLLMVVGSAKAIKEIPEDTRVTIRNSANRINDIANLLLSKYDSKIASLNQEKVRFLISAALQQILTEKKYEYQKRKVKFEHNFSSTSTFAFININPTAFKQMISNIINNAVDAFGDKEGKVVVHLDVINNVVQAIIEDNGKGIPPEVVNKIMKNIVVTSFKENGHGIGFTQVRETLQSNDGTLLIDSTLGIGTKVILTFPKVESPSWITDKIELNTDDLVVILDDDPSIHGAWQTKFKSEAPNIRLKHFDQGGEAIAFIKGLPYDRREKVFLLTDYELLEQGISGINVIEESQVKRSILVTSYADTKKVRELIEQARTRVLPKMLAAEVPIKINQEFQRITTNTNVDMVVVDDDKFFMDAFCNTMFSHKKVSRYSDPITFLENISLYPKNMLICLDNQYKNFDLTGLDVAKILYGNGYTNLYMISGNDFADTKLPGYLKVILKTDIDRIEEIAKI